MVAVFPVVLINFFDPIYFSPFSFSSVKPVFQRSHMFIHSIIPVGNFKREKVFSVDKEIDRVLLEIYCRSDRYKL